MRNRKDSQNADRLNRMRVALVFIDGVGIGQRNPQVNPLANAEFLLSQFEDGSGTMLPAGTTLLTLDATSGISGRPQSATNQTSLYSGIDAPAILGQHILGYPNTALQKILKQHSIFSQIVARGLRVRFLNAFPAQVLRFFDYRHTPSEDEPNLTLPAPRHLKASASCLAMQAAQQVEFLSFDDARAHRALTHDITGRAGRARGLNLPLRSPREAAELFWREALEVTLLEHFLADAAGHEKNMNQALSVLSEFDAFFRSLIELRPADAILLVVSDHGNVEDISVKNHTLHRIPLLVTGAPPLLSVATLADLGRWVVSLATESLT
jgi:Metalloenzyme superfamily